MTPDDAQIDVLMRRYASRVEPNSASGHLDPDELNAFAEGSLPAAARSSYVSHLAECDDCRKLATQLTVAAGVDRVAVAGAGAVGTESLWRKLTAFFATPALRYVAFASVLIVAGGVLFFSLRQPREASLIAARDTPNQGPGSAVKPEGFSDARSTPGASSSPTQAGKSEEVPKLLDEKTHGLKAGESAPSPATDTLIASSKTAPVMTERRAGELSSVPASPSYAPPPPGESGAGLLTTRGRDEAKPAAPTGPRKSDLDYSKLKTEDSARSNDVAKDSRSDDENRARNLSQNRVQQRESPRPSGPMLSRNQSNEVNRNQQSNDAAGNATGGAGRAEAEKKQAPEKEEQPREVSVSGHKFRRQGGAWVDEKFKSSMSINNISRGSDAFRALDSSVRSIADQLGGAVIVVSKGKAYRIQ